LAEELSRRYPALPIVWMSGHPRDVEFPKEVPGPERAFLMKPVAPEALLETITQVLRGAGSRSQ
jgi:DNA-binding NtrC family response regulator